MWVQLKHSIIWMGRRGTVKREPLDQVEGITRGKGDASRGEALPVSGGLRESQMGKPEGSASGPTTCT